MDGRGGRGLTWAGGDGRGQTERTWAGGDARGPGPCGTDDDEDCGDPVWELRGWDTWADETLKAGSWHSDEPEIDWFQRWVDLLHCTLQTMQTFSGSNKY